MSCNKHEFESEEYKQPKKNNMKKVFILAFTVLLIGNLMGAIYFASKDAYLMYFVSLGAVVGCHFILYKLNKNYERKR